MQKLYDLVLSGIVAFFDIEIYHGMECLKPVVLTKNVRAFIVPLFSKSLVIKPIFRN